MPLLLFLAVLLTAGLAFNLANLDTGGESVPALPDAGGTDPTSRSLIGLLPLLQIAVSLAGVLFVAYVVHAFLRRDRKKRPAARRIRRSEFVRTLALIVIMVLVLALWRGAEPTGDSNETATEEPPAVDGFGVPDLPSVAGVPLVVFLAASLLVGLVVVAYLFRGTRMRMSMSSILPAAAPARAAAAEAVETAIETIDLGGDVRAAILACFRRFCDLLGARGVSGQAVLTPREIEGLAVSRLRVSPADAGELTSLFEEARYSGHPLGVPARDRARDSLERIRRALEA